MPKIISAVVDNGLVRYVGKVDSKPATTETTGNVTINNYGTAGVPSYFNVHFDISSKFSNDGIDFDTNFILRCVVQNNDSFASYRSIEIKAANTIPKMLRSIADELEKEISTSNERIEGSKNDQ